MRAVIFANGLIRKIHLVNELIEENDFIISADGGLRYIRSLNLKPNLVVGDLDSINNDDIKFLNINNIEILKFSREKDKTDLEIAIRESVKRSFRKILIIGALGGRIDQTLANLGLIASFSNNKVQIEFDDGQECVKLIQDQLLLSGKKGDTVSLIPLCLPVKGITTKGLKYSLHGESLLPYQTRGISNEMLGDSAIIEITSGTLLCIHIRIKIV
jgi:thiamine pyrophosphokinase